MIEEIQHDTVIKVPGGKDTNIGPGWCKGTTKQKYRENVLQAMKLAQNRYLRRKIELSNDQKGDALIQKLQADYNNIKAGKDKMQFTAENIVSIEEDRRRILVKKSSCFGRKLQRYFEVTKDDNFAYYAKETAQKPKKEMDLEKFECEVQQKHELNATELKTWTDKEAKNTIRVKISVPKKKKKRAVYFYTDDLFEAEYLKLEIEKDLLNALREHVHSANQIFKTNVCSNLEDQMIEAPIRKNNFSAISAICESMPNPFAHAMAEFGQRLIDKAKARLAPKNKWLFDCLGLQQIIEDGKKSKRVIKDGKILFADDGLQFINESRPEQGFSIEDYDSLHAVLCKQNAHRYDITLYGRKMKTVGNDEKEVQDPMERLLLSKANRSNLIPKNLLVIVVKSISLGNFHDIGRGEEIAVRIGCGTFYLRTSYIKEQPGVISINEKFVIDLDNDAKNDINIYIDKIPKNNLTQFQKDSCEVDTIGTADIPVTSWSKKNKSMKVQIFDEGVQTDIVVNIEAYATNSIPSKETMPSLLEGEVYLCGRDVLYKDTSSVKYPPNQYLFESWGCVGKFEANQVGKSILPL